MTDVVAADEPEHALAYVYNDEEGRQMFGLTDPNRGEAFIATDTVMEVRP